jgi:hypothetical protein
MRTPRSRIRLPALFAIFLMASPALSWAHGSVAESKEGCVITFDFYSAHFNVFQPQTRQHTAFCEDLPDVTETLFVLEYLHDSLREVPVEFRILRNTSPLGRFVRWEHLQAMGDLDASDGVPATRRAADRRHFERAVPLRRGRRLRRHRECAESGKPAGVLRRVPLFGRGALVAQSRVVGAGAAGPAGSASAAAHPGCTSADLAGEAGMMRALFGIAFLLLANQSLAQLTTQHSEGVQVTAQSQQEPIPLNVMHSWIITLRTPAGAPMADASIRVEGGMPAHDHGLATRPQVTRYLGEGRYLLEGVRFHMAGEWLLQVEIEHQQQQYSATVALRL